MPIYLSVLWIIHNFISLISILIAFIGLFRDGKINPSNIIGKLYIALTLAACVTALPVVGTRYPAELYFLAIMILVLLLTGIYAKSIRIFGTLYDYVQVLALSSTIFLSLIPPLVETLTMVPAHHPLASRPGAPIVVMSVLLVILFFLTVVQYQVMRIKSNRSFYKAPAQKIIFQTTFMAN